MFIYFPVWQIAKTYLLICFISLFFAFFSLKFIAKNKIKLRQKNLKILGFGLLGLYAFFLLFVTLRRYYNFSSQVIDVSYFHSTIWQLSRFKIPKVWDSPRRFVWGDHFHPILFFFVPIYWLVKDAGLLMALQALIVFSGTIPLILLAKHKFKSLFLGLSFSFAYLLFGGLQMGWAYGFHEIILLPPFLFWTYYFWQIKNLKAYWLFLFLSLMVKEEVAFIALFFGLYLVLVKKAKKIGSLTMLAGLAWFILTFKIIIPYFNLDKRFMYWGYYQVAGSQTLTELIKNSLLHPNLFFKTLLTPPEKISTFFHQFGSFGFLPFLSPLSLILVIPSLLQKMLCGDIARFNGFHYSAAITAVVIIASFESLGSFFKRSFRKPWRFLKKPWFWGFYLLFVSLTANYFHGYLPLSFFRFKNQRIKIDVHDKLLYQVIKLLPTSASVTAQYQIAPHINRPYGQILDLPHREEKADYVLFDLTLPLVLTTKKDFLNYLNSLLENEQYQLILEKDGILLFQKIPH